MKKYKKILIPIIVLALLVGSFFGARAYRSTTATAEIIPMESLNMSWVEDQVSIDGIVYDSDSQNVYVSTTQIINEIHVSEGQTVKAGDPLITFDMTSQEITLQLKELSVLRAENDLNNAYAELRKLQQANHISD